MERFWSKVEKTDECWIWTACKRPSGYGLFKHGGVAVSAHRFSYEEANGPIPDGMQIDHLCCEKSCVRPSHLRVCTPAENTHAEHSMTTGRINAAKTHCPHGHQYTSDNTSYVRTNKNKSIVSRACRACMRDRNARRKRSAA